MRSRHLKLVLTVVFALLFFLLPYTPQAAADKSEGEARYYYVGQVGEANGVQMEIIIDSEDVRGSYYYDKKGIPLSLSGTLDHKDSTIRLEEVGDKRRITGIFKGKLTTEGADYAKTIEGEWSKPGDGGVLPFKLTKVADYTSSTASEGAKIEASYLYPDFLSKDPALQKINTILRDEITTDRDKFILEAKEFFSSNDSSGGWQQSLSYSIAYYSDGLISLTGELYSYTGGAHGNTYYKSSNYIIKDGQAVPIKLPALFNPSADYIKALSTYCVNDLLAKGAGWIVSGEIKSLSAKDLSVFAVSPRGIEFAFAPYAVGPYAQGSYFVTVPYRELRGIVNLEGPLSRFYKSDAKQ